MIRQDVVNLLAAAYAQAGQSDEGLFAVTGELGAIEFEHRPTDEERDAALRQWRIARETGARADRPHLRVVKDNDDV